MKEEWKPRLISWEEAEKYKYHSGTLLIDLREPAQYQEGHLSGAWNVAFDELENYLELICHYDYVIFYCASGNHSLKAAKLVGKRGKQALSIAGGYESRYGKKH